MDTHSLSIGEFSIETRLSPKALRLYDRLGLLRPDRVDAASGYRWYDPTQVNRARTVGLLRQLEMPLALIAQALDRSPQQAIATVRAHAESDSPAASERAELARYVCLLIDNCKESDVMINAPSRTGPCSAPSATRTQPNWARCLVSYAAR